MLSRQCVGGSDRGEREADLYRSVGSLFFTVAVFAVDKFGSSPLWYDLYIGIKEMLRDC